MSILDYWHIDEMPPPAEEDKKLLRKKMIRGSFYLQHPKTNYFWDHNFNIWVKWPRKAEKSIIDVKYYRANSPEIESAITEFIATRRCKDEAYTKEQLLIILSLIWTCSTRRNLIDSFGNKNNLYTLGLSHRTLEKLSSHGPDFIKHLVNKRILSAQVVIDNTKVKNTFYAFDKVSISNNSSIEPICYDKNAKKLQEFENMLFTKTATKQDKHVTEVRHTAQFNLALDEHPTNELNDLELKRLRKNAESFITDDELQTTAAINIGHIIAKTLVWNKQTYEAKCNSIEPDKYSGRLHTIFTQHPKWTRQYAKHIDGKVFLCGVDMRTAQYQLLMKEFDISSGNLYEDIFHRDYYTTFAHRSSKPPKPPLNRDTIKERGMIQLFGSKKGPYPKQFIRIYPEIKEVYLQYKQTHARNNGKQIKDFLNWRLQKREVLGMRRVIIQLEKMGLSCIKVHDELLIYIAPDKLKNFSQENLEKYYIKAITSIFLQSFWLKETQLHVQFAEKPEYSVSCWTINSDKIILLFDNDLPFRIFSKDKAVEEKWMNRLRKLRLLSKKYGSIDLKLIADFFPEDRR